MLKPVFAALVRALVALSISATLCLAQPPKSRPAAPVVEEEPSAKPAQRPPAVEEEAPVKAGPKSPAVEEEPAPSRTTEQAAAAQGQTGAPAAEERDRSDDNMLRAPSVISIPRLDLRLFADVGYSFEKERKQPSGNGFNIGGFDLFASSKLNDRVSVLIEGLFELDSTNEYHFDLERVLLRYRQSRYLNIDAGRFHSSISYYNSNFHHGRWFETTAERPLIANWEDDKGILPSHGVGLQISGALPSPEMLPMSYFIEFSNGRGFANGQPSVQSYGDTDRGKAVNFGVVFKPVRLPGLQLGTAFYRDTLSPFANERWRENIHTFHAVYLRGNFQWLNEVVMLRHTSLDPLSPTHSNLPGFYSQFGYRFGKIVPYTRYDWLNATARDPISRAAFGSETGLRKEFAGGIFYDLSSFSALKVQADRAWVRGVPTFEARVQLAFAF